jgi:exopolysaccharide biosynthesis polyprenyl glycosylphosphotransferase
MATDFSLRATGHIGVRFPSLVTRPRLVLAGALRAALPVLLDLCCVAIACAGAILLYELHRVLEMQTAWRLWLTITSCYGAAYIILAQAHHVYAQRPALLQVADTARILRVSSYGLILLLVVSYCVKAEMPRLLLAYFWLLATPLLVILKYSTSRMVREWKSAPGHGRRVLICGTTRETRRLFSYLLHSPQRGQIPVGFLDESGAENRRVIYSHDYDLKHHLPVIFEPLTEDLLRSLDIQEIFVPPTVSQAKMSQLLTLASATGVRVSLVGAGLPHFDEHPTSVQIIDGLMVTSFDTEGEHPLPYMAVKRCMDVVLAGVLILLTSPVWAIAAMMVKATSKGPVFFRHHRTGQFGKRFVMLKFRSMYENAPKYSRSPECTQDRRVTPAGRILRKTSLDELPQLLNVLRGEMSLVGPRPEMPYITDQYTPLQRRRLSVPQGLTGLWQLSGDRQFSIHEAIEYDLYYIENRGFFLDIAILLHTLFFAMKGI